jgi:hypothetical protein
LRLGFARWPLDRIADKIKETILFIYPMDERPFLSSFQSLPFQ